MKWLSQDWLILLSLKLLKEAQYIIPIFYKLTICYFQQTIYLALTIANSFILHVRFFKWEKVPLQAKLEVLPCIYHSISKSIMYLLQNFCVLSQYSEFLVVSDWPFLFRIPWRLCPWKQVLSVSSSVQLNWKLEGLFFSTVGVESTSVLNCFCRFTTISANGGKKE